MTASERVALFMRKIIVAVVKPQQTIENIGQILASALLGRTRIKVRTGHIYETLGFARSSMYGSTSHFFFSLCAAWNVRPRRRRIVSLRRRIPVRAQRRIPLGAVRFQVKSRR